MLTLQQAVNNTHNNHADIAALTLIAETVSLFMIKQLAWLVRVI